MIRRSNRRSPARSAARSASAAFWGVVVVAGSIQGAGVMAQGTEKSSTTAENAAPTPKESRTDDRARAPIVRDRVRLTLEGAQLILDGSHDQAAAMDVKANIWVVDDGGHPLAFERMDGGRPASVYTSLTKAVSAATFRQPSGPIPPGAAQFNPILNTGIEHAAAAGGGKITTLYGGVPILVDGQVIGGVGVGGGTGEQDAKIARAGIDRFLKCVQERERPSPKTSAETAKPARP